MVVEGQGLARWDGCDSWSCLVVVDYDWCSFDWRGLEKAQIRMVGVWRLVSLKDAALRERKLEWKCD